MAAPNYRRTLVACYIGYIMQAIVNNIAPLFFVIFQKEFGLSLAKLGTLILFNFGVQLAVDITMSRFGDRFSYRSLIVTAHFSGALGLCFLGILPRLIDPYTGILISIFLCAFGGGLTEVVVSPMVDALPSDCKEASMSLLHSFYCWGQVATVLLTTLGVLLFGDEMWWIIPILWSILPFFNAVNFFFVPLVQGIPEGERQVPLKELLRKRFFIMAMVIMICGGATELVVAQWSSYFAETGLGISKIMGDILGPALFAVFMGIGRTFYGICGSKINIRLGLLVCAGFGIFCYLAIALVPNPVFSLFACALTGFSASLMWPGTLSFTSARYPGGGTSMFALLAFCGDIGCSLGPWLTGLISDAAQENTSLFSFAARFGISAEAASLRAGLLVGVLFPLIMFLLLTVSRKKDK